MKKRITFLDVFKGLAIILVVLGHSCNSTKFIVNRFILSFHMPAFFFCSGILFNTTSISMKTFLKKKMFSLVIPMLTLGVITLVIEILLTVFKIAKGNLSNPIAHFFSWFLLSLFIVECICFFCVRQV